MQKFVGKDTPAKRAVPTSSVAVPSSSPAFATPAHPLKPYVPTPTAAPARHAVLPIDLPPAALRPLAFRTFTKKHSLTLTSSSLEELAAFVGRHCGSAWREEGLAERVLEEVAKSWKGRNGGVIVDGANVQLKDILTTLEANMSGGRIIAGGKGLSRQNSSLLLDPSQDADLANIRQGLPPQRGLTREDSQKSFGISNLAVDDEIDDEALNDVRKWLRVVDAYQQPRLIYNVDQKHFEKETTKPSIMPGADRKTLAFRNRYNVMQQRLLRHESFQTSAVATARISRKNGDSSASQAMKITPIANMLGRHGTQQMLLGLLVILPAGELAISDLTGTITLDLARAEDYPPNSTWFVPGMIVLVDGIYEEEDESSGKGLGGSRGIGGVLGGKFVASFVGHLSCERRATSLGMMNLNASQDAQAIGGGFGWVDFLGVGSERAVGQKMRRVEQRLLRRLTADEADARGRLVILGEVNLDDARTLPALRRVFSTYAPESQLASPLVFVVTGNFTKCPVMARGRGRGSVEYKEYFDELGTVLAEFPSLVKDSTFVFVPGDNDGWISAGATGASVPIPRKPVPDLFTSRIRRVFASQATDDEAKAKPEAIWASNPARLSLFGPTHEIVLFRDDMLARMQRNAVSIRDRELDEDEETSAAAGSDQPNSGHDDVAMADAQLVDPDLADPADDADGKAARNSDAAKLRTAQKLVKTILDQGYLAPFSPAVRPVNWDYTTALHLYPLPSAMVLVDTSCPPFCVTYDHCHVMNPGALLVPDRRGVARWIEYRIGSLGQVKDCRF